VAESGPDAYASFVSGLLDAEAARRTALEQKGSGIITTAGTLVTLLFGLVAVVTAKDTFTLPGATHGWLVAAVILLVVACLLGILAGVPLPYGETQISADDLIDWWQDGLPVALLAISGVRLEALAAARQMNTVKAIIVMAATATLVAALAMLAVAVMQILVG
jgi:hypothetical protein